jgi:hypothetical protein
MLRSEKEWVKLEVQTTMTQHERAGTLAGPPPIPQLPTKSTTNPTDEDDGNWEQIYDYATSSFLFVNQKMG